MLTSCVGNSQNFKVSCKVVFGTGCLVYFTISVLLGAAYTIKPVHDFVMNSAFFAGAYSHIALLGWVSFALMGILYHTVPKIAENPIQNEKYVNIQFWLMNIGVASMFVLLMI
ncbi:MAG: hypothetical protein GWP12_02110 [Nitrospirae bacterium]|nr:hypothetical protein [Nitrospirota bacterium]